MSKNLKLTKISDLPEAKSINNLLTLGVDSNNNSVKVPIELLKGNKGDTGESGGNLTSKSIYNITQTTGLTYSDKKSARNAVASNLRASGQIIAYKLDQEWINEQYIGADINGWGVESNWKGLGEVNIYLEKDIKNSLTIGKYINPYNGLSYPSNEYHYSEFIKVNKGQKLLITGTFGYNPTDVTVRAGIAGYSTNKEDSFVANIFSPTMIGATTQGRYTVIDFLVTVPDGVNYIKGSSVFATTVLSIKDAIKESIQTLIPNLIHRVSNLEDSTTTVNDLNLEEADIESGSVNIDGSDFADSTRLRTKNYYSIINTFEVTALNAGFSYRIIGWKNGVYVGMADWSNMVKSWNLSDYGFNEIRIIFRKEPPTTITVSEFPNIGFKAKNLTTLKSLVLNTQGGASSIKADIITRNFEAEKAILAVRKKFDTQNTTNETDIFTIAHISDLHEDPERLKNFIEYCAYIKVDAAAITGDIVKQYYNDNFSYYKSRVLNTSIKMYHVLGNHENERGTNETDAMQHARFFADLDTKMGMIHEGKCYYYTDFAEKKTRIIGLNQFQYGGTIRENRYLKDDQIAWFINTLKSTPQNYGIVILTHIPEHDWSVATGYEKFWQKKLFFNDLMSNITGSPIYDIVDAFIGRTLINKSYTQNGTLSTLTVNANFSTGVNTGVEFIAYLNGHLHADRIGYLTGTAHKQLVLNIICGNAFVSQWRDGLGDLPRKAGTATEDAINIYGFDRTLGAVKIARIGSNVNYHMEKRDFMCIPYK